MLDGGTQMSISEGPSLDVLEIPETTGEEKGIHTWPAKSVLPTLLQRKAHKKYQLETTTLERKNTISLQMYSKAHTS